MLDQVTGDDERLYGPDHIDTLGARDELAAAYLAVGRPAEAAGLYRRTLAGRERVQGPRHPQALTTRQGLGDASQADGRSKDATAPSAPSGGCGAELSVTGPDGQPTVIGFCEHWHEGPGSMKLTWGAARRFRLTAHAAGPAAAGALGELLSRWQAHLAAEPEAGADDTAATVMWPSRDTPRRVTPGRKLPLRASRLRAAGRPAAGGTPQCRWPGALSR